MHMYDDIGTMKPMFYDEINSYEEASKCYLCKKPFVDEKNRKIRDDNHLTGRYRGAAYNNCNMEIGKSDFIPVFIHNLSNYDDHLFIKQFGKLDGKIRVIPETDEKYISISMKAGEIVSKETGELKNYWYKEVRF